MKAAAVVDIQQVNLYQPILRRQEKVFSSATLVQALAVVAAALLAIWGYGAWQVHALDRQVQLARGQQAQSEARLQQLQRLYPEPVRDRALAGRVAAAEKELAQKRRVLHALSERAFGNTAGFVDQLQGLARQSVEGLWLSELELAAGGTRLRLRGNALAPELVPRYLQRLSAEPVFAGTEFQTFLMQRAADDRSIAFLLSTEPAKEGKR